MKLSFTTYEDLEAQLNKVLKKVMIFIEIGEKGTKPSWKTNLCEDRAILRKEFPISVDHKEVRNLILGVSIIEGLDLDVVSLNNSIDADIINRLREVLIFCKGELEMESEVRGKLYKARVGIIPT